MLTLPPSSSIVRWQILAVLRSIHTMALCNGLPAHACMKCPEICCETKPRDTNTHQYRNSNKEGCPVAEPACGSVPDKGCLALVCDAQGHDFDIAYFAARSFQSLVEALIHALPDLQRVMLHPSAHFGHHLHCELHLDWDVRGPCGIRT